MPSQHPAFAAARNQIMATVNSVWRRIEWEFDYSGFRHEPWSLSRDLPAVTSMLHASFVLVGIHLIWE